MNKIVITSNMQWAAIGIVLAIYAAFLLVSVGGLLIYVIRS